MDVEDGKHEISEELQDSLIAFINRRVSSCSKSFSGFKKLMPSIRVSTYDTYQQIQLMLQSNIFEKFVKSFINFSLNRADC